MTVSLCRALSRQPSPSISLGVSHARARDVMACGTLFSSQICLKVAAMPSAFPIPATTHWRAGGLTPTRPALWTGTAPPRYRAPNSPAPIRCLHTEPSPLPGKKLHHHHPAQGLCGTNCQYNTHCPVIPCKHSVKHVRGSHQVIWSQQVPCNQDTSHVTNSQHHSI